MSNRGDIIIVSTRYIRMERRLGRMDEEEVEELISELIEERDDLRATVRACTHSDTVFAKKPDFHCIQCDDMRDKIKSINRVIRLANRRLDNIVHVTLLNEFTAEHGRWPKNEER